MKMNTALGVALCGSALLVFNTRVFGIRAELFPALSLIAISTLTLCQYYLNLDLHIDNIFIEDSFSTKLPGRPSEATAVTLLFAGLCITLYSFRICTKALHCDLPILVGLFIPLLGVSSYIYGYESIATFTFIESMSLPTALSLSVFFIGFSLTQRESLLHSYFNNSSLTFRELRRLSFPVIIFPIAVGWIALYFIREQNVAPELGIASMAAICSIVAVIGLLWNSFKESKWQGQFAAEQKAKLLAQTELAFALETSMGAVLLFSSRGDVVAANSGASRIFGWEINEMKDMNLQHFIPPRLRDAHAGHVKSFRQGEKQKQVNDNLLNMVGYHKSGKEIPILVSINKQLIDGEMMFGAVIMDATGISDQLTRFKTQAEKDYLTDIANRHGLDAYIDSLQQERSGQLMSLLVVDIDYFKRVNDTYGHAVGDKLLQSFVVRIKSTLRFHDKLFRLGGEEFLVVSKRTYSDGAITLANRIRTAIASTPFACHDNTLSITCSIGVSDIRVGKDDFTEQLRKADEALYIAKREGRNCVRRCDEQTEIETAL
ncbi:diguanylate cyclase [Pontibacterium granulatum]|uniref:sensor domain-containing diguanylate cyclase n=1 Tax=Pontibacterium granulatum TaxID=2036029 RepID=UPI00249BA5A2|nr:diguanylate cyclase [Pontibacterium granulatum]MDI3325548.1 diguanylate cyclase [Pontibacterium granulatum]